MEIRYFERGASAAEVKTYIDEWGFAICRNWLDTDVVDDIARDIRRYAERVVGLEMEFFGGGALKKVEGLAAKSAGVIDVMNDPFLTDLAEAYLGVDPLINATGGFVLEKGRRPQPLHHDDVLYKPFFPRIPGGPECMLNFMYAITDFTEENGATKMVPGSHLWPEGREPTDTDEVLTMAMPRGSFAVWLGSTWHGAGQNLTDTPRLGCEIGFNCGWLRPHENYQLLIPPGLARDMPLQVQEILGYKAHRGMLGCIEQRSPMEVFGFERRRSVRGVVQAETAQAVPPRELENAVRRYFSSDDRKIPDEAGRILAKLSKANDRHLAAEKKEDRDMLEVVAETEARAMASYLEGAGLTAPIEALRRAGMN